MGVGNDHQRLRHRVRVSPACLIVHLMDNILKLMVHCGSIWDPQMQSIRSSEDLGRSNLVDLARVVDKSPRGPFGIGADERGQGGAETPPVRGSLRRRDPPAGGGAPKR